MMPPTNTNDQRKGLKNLECEENAEWVVCCVCCLKEDGTQARNSRNFIKTFLFDLLDSRHIIQPPQYSTHTLKFKKPVILSFALARGIS